MTGMGASFKIDTPTGPGPFLSYDSDEESFVVLGKSLVNDIDYNSTEAVAPNGTKTIENAKRIIDEEIRKLSLNSQDEGDRNSVQTSSRENPFQELNSSSFDSKTSDVQSMQKKSTVFSEMETSFKKSMLSELESFAKNKVISEEKKKEDVGTASTPMVRHVAGKDERNFSSILDTSLGFDKIESITNTPSEDLQKKILDIIEENQKLKDTVKQNSFTMHEQCNRISDWQDEVKKVHEAHKQKLFEAKEHIDQLTHEKKEAANQISVLQDELDRARITLAEIQIVQTEVEQSRAAAYMEINNLKTEIKNLQQTMEELQKKPNNDDEIYVLKTQLEIYKADFEAERRAKQSIKEEKEKLIDDLQNLQRRNQQLLERIDMIGDRDFVMYETRENRNRDERRQTEILACPKCNSAFSDIATLQAHCDVCIN